MVQKLFDQNIFIYIMIGLLGGGILLKLLLNIVYSRLVRASDNMATSKNKLTKTMKKKFEACFKLKIGVNNVDIFVDKYVFRQRFCGILLSTWENICGQLLVLCLLVGSISTIMGLIYECGKQQILSTFSVGILTSGLLIFLEGLSNLGSKKELLRLNMKDYFENILKVRLEHENEMPELIEEYKKEYLKEESVQALNSSTLLAAASEKQIIKKNKPSKFNIKQEKAREKRAKKEAGMEARANKTTEKLEAKRKIKEEKEKVKNATRQAVEKKKENEKAEIERIRALAKKEEEKRKEEKVRQDEIKRMLHLEKLANKKSKNTSKAQENKEVLLKEFTERKNYEPKIEQEIPSKVSQGFTIKEVQPAKVVEAKIEEIYFAKPEKLTFDKKEEIEPVVKETKPLKEKRVKASTPEEEKLFEDILKEFLA